MDEVGVFKARAKKRQDGTWVQPGKSKNDNWELLVDMEVAFPSGSRMRTIVLSMTEKATPFSEDRLRAMGWKGDDMDFSGIGDNEVEVRVFADTWEGKETRKYEIVSGGGRFTSATPMSQEMFAAHMRAMRGAGGGGPPGAPPPPF